jgi:ribosomal protein S3
VIAREIADAIENRVSFRNAQKMGIKKVMASHAIGVKTRVSGRLGGAEMAREEGYSEGIIPLTTLRADLDYALEEAHTTYGKIGVKVWINRGEIFGKGLNNQVKPQKQDFKSQGDRSGRSGRKPRFKSNSEHINVAKPTTTPKAGE